MDIESVHRGSSGLWGSIMGHILLIVFCALFLDVMQITAEPIDTNQFGFLREGANIPEIVSRVGEPDEVLVLRKELRLVRAGVLREVVTYRWIYRGDSTLMRSILTIENGILIGKTKVRE